MIHGFHSEDCDDLRYKNDKLEQKIAKLEAELYELKQSKLIGTGYYAIPEDDKDYDNLQWWIVEKSFYDKEKYMPDFHLKLDIPDFGQDMESCFSYQPDYPSKDLEKQSKLLTDMGFTIIEGDF